MGSDLLTSPLVTVFRVALFSGIVLSIYLFFFKLKKPLPSRVLAVLLGSALAVFIIFPEWSDVVAQQFGIGRGVDMILYMAQVLWAHMLIRIYISHKALSQRVTELTRALALASAQPPELATHHAGEPLQTGDPTRQPAEVDHGQRPGDGGG